MFFIRVMRIMRLYFFVIGTHAIFDGVYDDCSVRVDVDSNWSSTNTDDGFISESTEKLNTVPFSVFCNTDTFVTVTCTLDVRSTSGITQVYRQNVSLFVRAFDRSREMVDFRVLRGYSRLIHVQCFVSDVATSTRKRRDIESQAGGKVHVYSAVNIAGDPIYVKLSEPAVGHPVYVTCKAIKAKKTYGIATVEVGQQMALLNVTYARRTNNTLTIVCSGQSDSNGRQYTSSNSQGTNGTVLPSVPSAELHPQVTALSGPEFQLTLMLTNVTSAQNVQLRCAINKLSSSEEALSVTVPRVCPGKPALKPVLPSHFATNDTTTDEDSVESHNAVDTEWTIDGDDTCISYAFDDNLFEVLTIQQIRQVKRVVTDMLCVTCVGPSTGDFSNIKTSLIISVTVYPSAEIDWSYATKLQDQLQESRIIDPAYTELAPCPCDLNANGCDVDCCCDPDCNDTSSFHCSSGPAGYRRTLLDTRAYAELIGLQAVLDIVRNNTPFIGYFYYPRSLIRDEPTFIGSVMPHEKYSFTRMYPSLETDLTEGYKHGLAIRTGFRNQFAAIVDANKMNEIRRSYLLTLPHWSVTGLCVRSAPVRFLVDSYALCNVLVTTSSCSLTSPLSALMYIPSPQWGIDDFPQVLAELNSINVTDTAIRFLCVKESAYDTRGFHSRDFASDTVTSVCSWNDGNSLPPAPLTMSGNVCDNIVWSVSYNFIWKGQRILSMTTTIVMGSAQLDVSDQPSRLSQEFRVTFEAAPSDERRLSLDGDSETFDDTAAATEAEEVSNWDQTDSEPADFTGYVLHTRVVSGRAVRDQESQEISHIDNSSRNSLKLISTDSSNLCSKANKIDVEFGVNKVGGCYVPVDYNSFTDCHKLRVEMLNAVNEFMPSDHIGLIRNPHSDYLSQWTNILRANVTWTSSSTRIITESLADPAAIPFIDLVWPHLLNGTKTPPYFSYSNTLKGICPNITSGINVNILYTIVGLASNHPIYHIIGARISYTLSTWKLACVAATGLRCHVTSNESSPAQNFMLSTSVNFFLVPPTKPLPLSRYEYRMSQPPYHNRHIIWSDLLYPFSSKNPGTTQPVAVAFGLLFLFLAVVAFIVVIFCTFSYTKAPFRDVY